MTHTTLGRQRRAILILVDALAITAAYLTGIHRQDRLAALCLAVTVIDNHGAGTMSALVDERSANRAKARSARQGSRKKAAGRNG